MISLMETVQNKNFTLLVIVIIFVAAILFPYGWLANKWMLFDQVMSWLFATEQMHVVGHLGLYAGLATAVLTFLPQLHGQPCTYFGLMLIIGSIQETLQLVSFKHRFFSTNELFDLGVDLFAAGIVFIAAKVIANRRHIYALKTTDKQ